MGMLTTAGSTARVVGPIFFTFVYEYYGTYITFSILLGVLVVSMILCLLCYKRFIPKEE
jgi:ceroid-lipofuscinosis MFS transporter 7